MTMPPADKLLDWYDRHRRQMPWRAVPGETPDPYRVWLSEIMLQQTTVAAVIPYYQRFVSRFPSVEALAQADLTEVLLLWSGLGYYARARNLHACAHEIARLGGFPRELDALRHLPGIGAYTAAAMVAIAFNRPALPVDGNVERVMARIHAVEQPLPAAKPVLRALAEKLPDDPAARARPADFAQALFDLGATVCTPTSPGCLVCPWRSSCAAERSGSPASFPRRSAKPPRPWRYAAHFWLIDENDNVLLRQRPNQGLMGGLFELPGTPPADIRLSDNAARAHAPQAADWMMVEEVRHGFTHFELTITVFATRVTRITAPGTTCHVDELGGMAMASVMRKCVDAARRGMPARG